ncbi:ATP-binding SpoIIE family protein phosphatase [Lentzea sp.]|uniref:ATP-binding SpoIIE family protein phosphatase n=1 Tax=Lentzea sp. TaxID=56099 RepID=UPI002D0EF059|nr:SpoIIE family protein phosphatase [Lentzea sp.]HUQ59479.1 SpoIIE family protein phosphatase [Lentzea sp.]
MNTPSPRHAGDGGFASFGLSDVVRLTAELRAAAESADDFASAATAVVERLRGCFTDERGESAVLSAGLFSTRRFAELPEALQRFVRETEPDDVDPDTWCLVLEAGSGMECAPAARRVPGAVAPTSAEAAAATPMADALGLTETGERCGVFLVPDADGSDHVPDQGFVRAHGVRSVLAFGGALPDGGLFCVVLPASVPISSQTAELFRSVAVSVRTGLLTHPLPGRGKVDVAAQRDALLDHLRVLEDTSRDQAADLENTVHRLRAEAELVDTLQVVGRRLTSQLHLDTLVQDATDAATKATGAEFGAFFYNLVDQYGESYTLYTLSGVPRSAFERFPMPRNTDVFSVTFNGEGTVRSDDITRDSRYGRNDPYGGMPPGHLPVRSYLAVPVVSPSSREVLGGFFFGHHETGRFTERHEQLAEGIAGYAAIALDNARLFDRQRSTATELTHSMLPTVPHVNGLAIASRYLPAATGSEVGGDWFDVLELPAGRTAFVVGDVVGRGVTAAAVMGQMRTAVRSYALLDLPPSDVLRQASALAGVTPRATFITCFYAVHDPADDTLTYASAGHLPAVLTHPDGTTELIGEGLGMPLGVGEAFRQRQTSFPVGARLTLYTDGLVESRVRDLSTGIDALLAEIRALPPDLDLQVACDKLIDRLTAGRHDDDVALLHVHRLEATRQVASLPLEAGPAVASQARAFVTEQLVRWNLAEMRDAALTVASELVANAVQHADRPVMLRLQRENSLLFIDVADHGISGPRLFTADPRSERHRGLVLVDAFATRWGTRATEDGKVVWAEITTTRAPGQRGTS